MRFLPQDSDYYAQFPSLDRAEQIAFAKTSAIYNRDMRQCVLVERMRPDRARLRFQAQWSEVFRELILNLALTSPAADVATVGGAAPKNAIPELMSSVSDGWWAWSGQRTTQEGLENMAGTQP